MTTIEFLDEHHSETSHGAMAKLSGHYSSNIRETFVGMSTRGVLFHEIKTHTKNPPELFGLTVNEADAFVEAWTQFKYNTQLWEAEETERKEKEAAQEAERQAAVWKEVELLAASIPGIEITVREDEYWDKEKNEYVTGRRVSVWDVWHGDLNDGRINLDTADRVLDEVKRLIKNYHKLVADAEHGEKEVWYGWSSASIARAQKFLATHRAWIAAQEAAKTKTEAIQAAQQAAHVE